MLKIAKNLSLPLDFITERIAFLARTGAGKSGGMRVMFEQMLDAKQFVIFIDPKGDAWGIRAAGIGKGRPVLVMGGDYGDVPLEATAGKYIAEFLVRERVSTVLDISDFSTADMNRFITDLAGTLYKRNRDVLHMFIDEADMVAGERFFDPKTLHAIQLIQNKGRHRGFGVTVATQRSAILNKSVLFASGTLVAMQTTGPNDIKAVRGWLEVAATPEATKVILAALPTLKTREAFVYSPQTLGPDPVRIIFDEFKTFDSMRTPRPGETRQAPKSVADIDLSAVQRDMAATIEKVRADDPRLLRAKIHSLELEKERLMRDKPAPEIQIKEIEIPVFPAGALIDLRNLHTKIAQSRGAIEEIQNQLNAITEKYESDDETKALAVAAAKEVKKNWAELQGKPPAKAPAPEKAFTHGSFDKPLMGSLPDGERKVLTAIAQYSDRGGATRDQVTLLTGYKRSTRDAYINRLATKAFVVGSNNRLFAQPAGIAALGDFEPMPTGSALKDWWLERLPEGEAKVFRVVLKAHPHWVDRDSISEETEYKRSTRDAYINRLGTRRLVETNPGEGVRASDDLF